MELKNLTDDEHEIFNSDKSTKCCIVNTQLLQCFLLDSNGIAIKTPVTIIWLKDEYNCLFITPN